MKPMHVEALATERDEDLCSFFDFERGPVPRQLSVEFVVVEANLIILPSIMPESSLQELYNRVSGRGAAAMFAC